MFFGRFGGAAAHPRRPARRALRVPYRRFLVANAAGGLVWAFGTTYLLFYVGRPPSTGSRTSPGPGWCWRCWPAW
ncbi:hypothetical protein V2I01_00775 [Micromonospora sp. BRA006-A]|nr:hypothetical protein [Micromonospora sp. BRA006-A]